jgi:hypothetical protein
MPKAHGLLQSLNQWLKGIRTQEQAAFSTVFRGRSFSRKKPEKSLVCRASGLI